MLISDTKIQIKKLNEVNYMHLLFFDKLVQKLVVQKNLYKFVEHGLLISSYERKDWEFVQELKICLASDWSMSVQ